MRRSAGSNQSRALPALPLISRQSPRLVRPSVFLARSARLARYAVAQRVQSSRVWPHNGLKMRPTYSSGQNERWGPWLIAWPGRGALLHQSSDEAEIGGLSALQLRAGVAGALFDTPQHSRHLALESTAGCPHLCGELPGGCLDLARQALCRERLRRVIVDQTARRRLERRRRRGRRVRDVVVDQAGKAQWLVPENEGLQQEEQVGLPVREGAHGGQNG